MSELINSHTDRTFFHKRLLSTVCCAAIVTVLSAEAAEAESSDRATVWIELGAQLERMDSVQEPFLPPFVGNLEALGFESVSGVQRPPRYAIGGEGRIVFAPKDSDWILSANVRYGRANGTEAKSQRLPAIKTTVKPLGGAKQVVYLAIPPFLNATADNSESHVIVDFQAGKDVGLGMFESSNVSFGVRFAQFSSHRKNSFNGDIGNHQFGTDFKYTHILTNHQYSGAAKAIQSFRGIGPSLSMEASVPLIGHRGENEISFDWGLNGAVLFGRQKLASDSHSSGTHYKTNFGLKGPSYAKPFSSYHIHPAPANRLHSVTVPNIGAFAGASFRYSNAKISFGYRADFFFGAMDGGLDTRKTYDRNFYGPFATISVGLGG